MSCVAFAVWTPVEPAEASGREWVSVGSAVSESDPVVMDGRNGWFSRRGR